MPTDSTYAAAPFDHAKADVILRSSDNIDFRVFKLFLSLASPFFETLFDIPQPTQASEDQEIKDGLAVIPMAEDSKTLDALLRFCYPCTLADDPNLEVIEDVVNVLQAAKKYSLDAIEKKVAHMFSNSKILEAEPFRCFVMVHLRKMQEETALAAKHTLARPLLPSWFEEINLITAGDLLALLTYHRECGDAVHSLQADLSWIKTHYVTSQGCAWLSGKYYVASGYSSDTSVTARDCSCPRLSSARYKLFESNSLRWWEDFMEEMFVALYERPSGATVASIAAKTIQAVKASNCVGCSPRITEGMRDFSELLVKKVDEVVSQIKLDFAEPRNANSWVYRLGLEGRHTGKGKKKSKQPSPSQ